MIPLSLDKVNAIAPYEVQMVLWPNTYRFVTESGVDIAVSFDLDDIIESGESYMFNIVNVNKQRSPRDIIMRRWF